MKNVLPLEDMSDTLTKEKVDRCDNCGAYCKTIYSKGNSKEDWTKPLSME